MELRQLRHFVAVATEGNISRAAKKIFLTQPALSRQIKALEHEIGQCLLERRAQSVRLTPAGQLLLEEARHLLEHAAQVVERVRHHQRPVRLRVGYAPSLASSFLPAAVEQFRIRHPDARVELHDLSSTEMVAGLQAERLDLAVTVERDGSSRGLAWAPLVRSPWTVAVRRLHPLARRRLISPAQLADQPILVYLQKEYPGYWEALSTWFRSQRLRPHVAGEYDGAQSLIAAVEAGLGIAVVTRRTARLFPGRVRFVPLSSPPPPLCIGAACLATRAEDAALAALIAELKTAANRAS